MYQVGIMLVDSQKQNRHPSSKCIVYLPFISWMDRAAQSSILWLFKLGASRYWQLLNRQYDHVAFQYRREDPDDRAEKFASLETVGTILTTYGLPQ